MSCSPSTISGGSPRSSQLRRMVPTTSPFRWATRTTAVSSSSAESGWSALPGRPVYAAVRSWMAASRVVAVVASEIRNSLVMPSGTYPVRAAMHSLVEVSHARNHVHQSVEVMRPKYGEQLSRSWQHESVAGSASPPSPRSTVETSPRGWPDLCGAEATEMTAEVVLDAWREVVGEQFVVMGAEAVRHYAVGTSPGAPAIAGSVLPGSLDEVAAVVGISATTSGPALSHQHRAQLGLRRCTTGC